jgi:hypothetical protein
MIGELEWAEGIAPILTTKECINIEIRRSFGVGQNEENPQRVASAFNTAYSWKIGLGLWKPVPHRNQHDSQHARDGGLKGGTTVQHNPRVLGPMHA